MKKIEKRIEKLIKKCGKIMLKANFDDLQVKQKQGCNNIATFYDIKIENYIRFQLKKIMPNASFIGEETEIEQNANSEYKFIVDPIDGTSNFARNNKMSAISIALLKNDTPILAFCYNPFAKELYKAKKGEGAFLNNKKICVSNKKLADGIAICGSSYYYEELKEISQKTQQNFILSAGDYRRFGSSVIELCKIASGSAEVFYEYRLMPWDYAAASLIVQEAGGKITDMKGNKIQFEKPTSILASNNVEDYLKYIKE